MVLGVTSKKRYSNAPRRGVGRQNLLLIENAPDRSSCHPCPSGLLEDALAASLAKEEWILGRIFDLSTRRRKTSFVMALYCSGYILFPEISMQLLLKEVHLLYG